MTARGHRPGGATKKNFDKAPRGRFKVRMKRAKSSRSKSARG